MIAAVVLAAGQSRRMGEPKQLLPLGSRRVIEWVIAALREAEVDEIIVVTGHQREDVEAAVGAI
ncbi:MAG: NTP transferase domain-containing protein, partial [Anaerolineae bacterium]|nr:NTP transferase domain-containing protein [Anaerolineae bacterium]